MLTAGALSCALAQSAPAGGYVAPVIEYPVDMTPIRGVTTSAPSNAALWFVGGAVILCAIFCFGSGDDSSSSDDDDGPDRPDRPDEPDTPDTPAPVPVPGALIGTLTASGALWAIRRKRRKG
ncbi:PEP-CTERM sorting domain-containing protein [Paracoccus albicereus]|uniref:PEP-CTERM sorting domain-containing protein n=1 Tax=Paracoccus albicereus TaxID=2922394 RepID=UPI002100CE66|nr:PEP-CTERM sorting domain-containing protein [Paracoccus albicereus]